MKNVKWVDGYRVGEIVCGPFGLAVYDHDEHYAWEFGNKLEVATISDVFRAAGHPVPDHCALWCQTFLDIDGEADVQWGWNGSALSAVFACGRWSRPGRETIPNPIDLSRLPALDAWDALPEVVRALALGPQPGRQASR